MIAAALGLVLAGLAIVSYTLADSGALDGVNEKYNIFGMIDDSLTTMQDMNTVMAEVKANVNALDERLNLLGETNVLLEEQLVVVDELNVLMAGQKPLLQDTGVSVSTLDGKLGTTLKLARGLTPVMGGIIDSMDNSVGVTSQVVDGSYEMVGVASYICSLFDSTLGYLARIQPHSSKAKAYMEGDILSRIFDFLPGDDTVADSSQPTAVKETNDGGPPPNLIEDVVGDVEEVIDEVLVPLLDPVLDILGLD